MGDGRLERLGLLHLREKPEELREELQRREKLKKENPEAWRKEWQELEAKRQKASAK